MYAWGGTLALEGSQFISVNSSEPSRAALVVAYQTQVTYAAPSFLQSEGYGVLLQDETSLLWSDLKGPLIGINPAGGGSVRTLDKLPPSAVFLDESDDGLFAIKQVRAPGTIVARTRSVVCVGTE